jgi:hypothetical protein
MTDLSTKQEYKPVLISRRSEFTAWLITICLVLLLVFYQPVGVIFSGAVLMLVVIGLSAVMISLGNWLDRHSSIQISAEGVEYSNGITQTALKWGEIRRVEVLRGQFGDKIWVSGENDSFRFQPLGTMSMNEKFTQQVGFEGGDQILETILKQTGFAGGSPQQTDSGYYYSRD